MTCRFNEGDRVIYEGNQGTVLTVIETGDTCRYKVTFGPTLGERFIYEDELEPAGNQT